MNRPNDRMLWMGDLLPYMDSDFIGEAFRRMGENIVGVKIIMDKYSGHRAGYCFVEMSDVESARRAMLQINGKIIPHSRPPIKFNLSFANNPAAGIPEYNLFVNNLPDELGDAELYQLFGKRYVSCRGAKVYRNPDGSCRGMGFVRFGDETDQQRALVEMNRQNVFGRPLALKLAPIRIRASKYGRRDYDPSSYYNQHQDYYNSLQWQMYDYQNKPNEKQQTSASSLVSSSTDATSGRTSTSADELTDIESYKTPAVQESNDIFMEQSEDFYDAILESCWYPNIHTASMTFDDL